MGLQNMRVVMQDATDPWETRLLPAEDAMFRICVFVADFGISLLEETKSRRALTLMSEEVLMYFRTHLRGEEQHDMRQSQDRSRAISGFLASIRAHPPTITISNRVVGEGATVLARWYRPGAIAGYNAKEAGQVRLNKRVCPPTYLLSPPSSSFSSSPFFFSFLSRKVCSF